MHTRRDFLVRATAFSTAFAGLPILMNRARAAGALAAVEPIHPFGPLVRDPGGILNLPAGFSYTVVSRHGETMDDGLFVPGRHDGMGAFEGPDGLTVLVRNHENEHKHGKVGAFGDENELFSKVDSSKVYDSGYGKTPALGGTTTVHYDTKSRVVKKHFMSLAGTDRNCAGGMTPWGSWLSCEESVSLADGKLEKNHGYVFEVASSATGLVEPMPINAMGRFYHEACCVDPKSGAVYMTEDRADGLIYRYLPRERGRLAVGGRLQALVLAEAKSADTRNWGAEATISRNTLMRVSWIDLWEVDSPGDSLRYVGHAAGAARFARGEGMWYTTGGIYWACTNGGAKQLGQIFRYHPSEFEGTDGESRAPGHMELFVESHDSNILKNADNICASPWGDMIVCEDSDAKIAPNRLVGVTPRGDLYTFASNAKSDSEFAGCCFSPDGTTLFANMQQDGLTLAVTGPWEKRGASR